MDNMTRLNILLDYVTRTANDLATVKTAMIQNDNTVINALLRYFRHVRDYSGRYEPTPLKRATASAICDIIETYQTEQRELKEALENGR